MEFCRKRVRTLLALSLFVLGVVSVACGSGEGSAANGEPRGNDIIQRVQDNGRTYTVDDLEAAGAKASKEYDVTELPGAQSAWRAFFDQITYEARFYPDHETAVDLGTGWAEIVSGPDAVVVGDNVRWQEGRNDRRQCNRAAETPHSGCNYTARYGDFVILGNLVLLCEGANSEEALEACRDLIHEMD